MVAVIVAGGKGTRLGLTDIPKCMAKINWVPLIERQITTLKEYDITEFYILTGHLSNVIEKHLGNGKRLGVKITYIVETEPLGTAGSIMQLHGKINSRFLVIYGDIIFDMDIKRLLYFAQKSRGVMTLVAHPNNHPYDSDLIEVGAGSSKVTNIHPKPHSIWEHHKNLVNSGIYVFSAEALNLLYEMPVKPFDIGKDVLPYFVKNYRVCAYITPEYIKDIGTPDRLKQAGIDIVSGKISRLNLKNKRRAVFLDRDGVINTFVPDLYRITEFQLIDGVAEAIREINNSEYLAIVVTNQPSIAKGRMTETDLWRMHNKMETLLGEKSAFVDAIYYCPHHPQKGFPGEVRRLKMDCRCRKPKPGMLLEAAKNLNIDLENSWMIGDNVRDIKAGIKAGCHTIAIGDFTKKATYTVKNLLEAVKIVMRFSK